MKTAMRHIEHTGSADNAPTPMMAQYLEVKAKHPDFLLFYRMGDFFELFFDDAVKAAQALGIQLTKRGKHLGEDIPMCGVPVVRADDYLHKLIRKGFRVAVAEQLENPEQARKRGAKAVVKRDVVRLVTPGTLTEDTLLEARASNFLTALYLAGREKCAYLASLDLSTGEFLINDTSYAGLGHELARLAPAEILLSERMANDDKLSHALDAVPGAARTFLHPGVFDNRKGERSLRQAYAVAAIDGFGSFSAGELAVINALLHYVNLTQIGKQAALRPPRRLSAANLMMINAATRASLELTRPQTGDGPTVLAAIDRTVTAAGARELAQRLASPLCDADAINQRLDSVEYLQNALPLRSRIRDALKNAPDTGRAMARIKLGRGEPRDLGVIRDGLDCARIIAARLHDAGKANVLPALVLAAACDLSAAPGDLLEALKNTLNQSLPQVFAEDR